MTRTIRRTALTATLLAVSCLAQHLEVQLASEATVKSRLEKGLVKQRERQGAIRELFEEAGCPVEEQRVDRKNGNVICTLAGSTNSTIVVGGHLDFVDRGAGIVGDWSGTSLLPSLYEAVKKWPREHTYLFVAFANEEQGLIGSSRYVKNLTAEQKSGIRAFVNLECLGLGPLKVWASRSNPLLIDRLREIASGLRRTVQGVNADKVGDDDTRPFLNAHIPVISLHSVAQETLKILHSDRDQVDAIHFDDYYNAYELVAFYLAYLDAKAN